MAFCLYKNDFVKIKESNEMMSLVKKLFQRFRGEQDIDSLVKRGLVVGKGLNVMGGVIIDPAHCWHIKIGNNVTLAPRVHILAHDASTKLFLGYTVVKNVKIGNNVFVGAGSIILPGVTIGDNVVVGAGSVVSRDVPSDSVAVGNPARVIRPLSEFLDKEKNMMKEENQFGEEFTLRNPEFSIKERETLLSAAENQGAVFVY